MKKIAKQMSESIELGIVLAASGGFMDAYSYIMRDHVFANAQTGNMLLLGVSISERNWPEVVRYLFPVLAFAAGIMLADLVRFRMDEKKRLHWRQISVLLEAIVLAGVCFIPVSLNLLANSLTSLACGIQVESFRKIHGNRNCDYDVYRKSSQRYTEFVRLYTYEREKVFVKKHPLLRCDFVLYYWCRTWKCMHFLYAGKGNFSVCILFACRLYYDVY